MTHVVRKQNYASNYNKELSQVKHKVKPLHEHVQYEYIRCVTLVLLSHTTLQVRECALHHLC